MSLKVFHLFFIALSTVLIIGFGGALSRVFYETQNYWYLLGGALSLGVGVGLVFYWLQFLKKMKSIDTLSLV